ncbi:MAG: ankyrin repeat domain-containing protein [Coriobacteriia bacterium]|nr:ankyrin repeat domain-containing protein [Coriobacteriia bacterium]
MSADVTIHRQRPTPLMDAVQNQDATAVGTRIAAGDGLEARDSWGQTALHWAAKYESAEIVGMLLAAGARTDARDEDGETPLDAAKRTTHTAIIDMLANAPSVPSVGGKKWWRFGK